MCDCFCIMWIYNTKLYLIEAIESVLNQTNSSLRLFLFDNGSTDGCKEICEAYKAKDPRIILYRSEENKHYSDLEPHAIIRDAFRKSQAKYFAFVDSDDRYNEKFLETTIKVAEKENADIVVAGYEHIDCKGNQLIDRSNVVPLEIVINNKNCSFEEMKSSVASFYPMWNKLYHANMYEDYWKAVSLLPSNALNGSDWYCMRYILSSARTIACISDILYQWRLRHRTKLYMPVTDSSWLYLLPIRNYVENKKFLSQFLLYKQDSREVQKWNGKLAYGDMKLICEDIVADTREDCNEKRCKAFYEMLSHADFYQIAEADWRIPIVIYNSLKCIEDQADAADIEKIKATAGWNIVKRKSSWYKRELLKVRMKMVEFYKKMKTV